MTRRQLQCPLDAPPRLRRKAIVVDHGFRFRIVDQNVRRVSEQGVGFGEGLHGAIVFIQHHVGPPQHQPAFALAGILAELVGKGRRHPLQRFTVRRLRRSPDAASVDGGVFPADGIR